MRITKFLYRNFATLWLIGYYVTFWRNPTFLPIVCAAMYVDAIRNSDRKRLKAFEFIARNRTGIFLSAIAVLLLYVTIIGFDIAPALTPNQPYLHFRQAAGQPGTWPAEAILLAETTSSLVGAGMIIFYSIMVSGQESLILSKREATQIETFGYKREAAKLPYSFIGFYVFQMSCWYIDVADASSPGRLYKPHQHIVELVMYCSVPIFFALLMKYWLREVRKLVIEEPPSNGR